MPYPLAAVRGSSAATIHFRFPIGAGLQLLGIELVAPLRLLTAVSEEFALVWSFACSGAACHASVLQFESRVVAFRECQ
jgi:hypothetical protein